MTRLRLPVTVFLASALSLAVFAPGISRAVSPRRAFFMSLLVPGWGEYAAGAHGRAAAFLSVEGGLWLGVAGFGAMQNVYRNEYRGYAASVAGANVIGQPDQYFSDLSFYDTRLQHNQAALATDGTLATLYPAQDDWEWPTTADRLRYRHMTNLSKMMGQDMGYVLFAVSLNHLISAIDAARLARGERGSGEAEATSRPSLTVMSMRDGACLAAAWRF